VTSVVVVCALVVAAYVLGVEQGRRAVASVFAQRFTCLQCGRKMDPPVSMNRCRCGEEYVGPAIADEIRQDSFLDKRAF
jgi:hypothetical protein